MDGKLWDTRILWEVSTGVEGKIVNDLCTNKEKLEWTPSFDALNLVNNSLLKCWYQLYLTAKQHIMHGYPILQVRPQDFSIQAALGLYCFDIIEVIGDSGEYLAT